MKATGWTTADVAVTGGVVVALAASADAAWSLHARFAVDFSGLSTVERAGAALWDFRPLATVLFGVGAIVALAGLRNPAGRLPPAARRPLGGVLAVLATAHSALGASVLAAAGWVAVTGELGERDELGFVYSFGDRVVTLATQIVAWVPLTVALGVVAAKASGSGLCEARAEEQPQADAQPPAPARSLAEEMEELWRERLAFGPSRERARMLLGRIRALEAAGDGENARKLAEEMRGLARR
jgi:hypothetical protein